VDHLCRHDDLEIRRADLDRLLDRAVTNAPGDDRDARAAHARYAEASRVVCLCAELRALDYHLCRGQRLQGALGDYRSGNDAGFLLRSERRRQHQGKQQQCKPCRAPLLPGPSRTTFEHTATSTWKEWCTSVPGGTSRRSTRRYATADLR